jgi:uncharacterized protein (DUF58 family)
MPSENPILDAAFLKKLERLAIIVKRPIAGQMKGEKRSVKRGTSIEFADYREYTLGDDLRYVDWNMAARLDKMFLKLFVEEEDLYLSLLLDSSKSMDFGTPKKMHHAIRTAAALGYIALSNYDRVSIQTYAASLGTPLPTQRGRGGVLPFFRYLEGIAPEGETAFSTSLRRYAGTTKQKGVAVVISDFFDPDWQDGLKALLARGFQVAVIHVLAPDELNPSLIGDLRIIDSETGQSKEMSVNPALMQRYQDALTEFCTALEEFCHRYGIDYLRTPSDSPFEELVLRSMRLSGLLR